jgi:spore coat polysaccharide biosynthesis predicted glycosyltransferase SpsG
MLIKLNDNRSSGVFKSTKQIIGAASVALTTTVTVGVNELLAIKSNNLISNIQEFDESKFTSLQTYVDTITTLEAQLASEQSPVKKELLKSMIEMASNSMATIKGVKLEIL